MNKIAEEAHETIHEHGGGHADPFSRRAAVLVSILAAALALTEIGTKSTANEYLANHIAVSDDYAFYQARNVRSMVKQTEASLLAVLGNATDPAVQKRIQAAEDYAARMRDDPKSGDGMKQLLARARAQEEARDHALHRYHFYEYCSGALEIGIVLSSVAVVTRIAMLAYVAAGLGSVAGVVAILVASGML